MTPSTPRPAYQKYDLIVQPSCIDGLGVFAAQVIAATRKIGEIRGESISVADARIRATRAGQDNGYDVGIGRLSSEAEARGLAARLAGLPGVGGQVSIGR